MSKNRNTFAAGLVALLLSVLSVPVSAQPFHSSVRGAVAQLPQATDSYVPTIYGIMLNSTAWAGSESPFGVYSFMPGQSVILTTAEHLDNWLLANSGGVWYGGKLYFMHSLRGSGDNVLNIHKRFDTETWAEEYSYTMAPGESAKLAADLTYDPVEKRVYGIFFTDDGTAYELGWMEFSDASPVKHGIKRVPISMVAIAANSQGELFGIGSNGFLYRFDKTTGDATVVGNTQVVPSEYRQSATFDFRTDKLYWAAMLSAGESALFEVSTATGNATRLGTFAHAEEITGLYIPFGLADDQAPSTAENLSVSFPGGALTGTFSFTIPTDTYGLTPLSGAVDYDIAVDGEAYSNGTSEAGARVDASLTLTEGTHTFTVVLSNAAGAGPKAKTTAYIGHDTPVAPGNLKLNINNQTFDAHLQWTAPERGVNDGYLDRANMVYRIVRQPDDVLVAENYTQTEITDHLPELPELHSYSYSVQASIGDKVSDEASTPFTIVGEAKLIPWIEDFSVKSTFNEFTVIDVDNDGWTWKYSASAHCADMNNNDRAGSTHDDDDWLITPPLQLQGDRIYDLEFLASSNWAWDRAGQEQLEVGFGENASAIDYEMVVERRIIQQTEENIPVKVVAKLRPTHDGSYFVGFHAVTPLDEAFHLYIHKISVTESSLLTSPDSVTNLRIEPAANGARRATIRFNAPTKDLAGDPLTTLTEIRVYREGDTRELLASLNAPEPGAELSYEDTKCVNGTNTYVVVPLAGEHEGQASLVSGWVGIDYPQAPQNIRAALTDGGIHLSWQAPSEVGINGGFVDTEDLVYNIYDKQLNLLASEVEDLEYDITGISNTGQQATNQYYVAPVGELGVGEGGVSNAVITGDPYTMPLHESFNNGSAHYLWWMTQDNVYYTFKLTKQESFDDEQGAVFFQGSSYYPNLSARLGSGKVSMAGTQNPLWSFCYHAYVGHDIAFTAKVMTDDYTEHALQTIDFKTLGGSNDWRTLVFDLTPFKDSQWVVLIIDATITGYTTLVVDNINVQDATSDDLAATLYAPASMRIGKPKDVKVTVSNLGVNKPTDYRVRLLANGEAVAEQQGVAIAPLDSTVFTFPYTAGVTAPSQVSFQAVVDLGTDANPDDNTTVQLATDILQPTLPAVQNLQGTAADGQVSLTWQAPDLSETTVTEDFEDYSSWLTDGFGQWQVIDQDKGRTYDMAKCVYPHQTLETAFMIFNNSETSGTRYPNMNAHSGQQMAASFDAIPAYTSLKHTADWLISPQLSGQAQTISFYARSVAEQYLEKLEVDYTTGEALTRSGYTTLKTVDGVPNAWTLYEVELPEGATHFAIKNMSTDMMALIVDDVTYEPLPLVLSGYDIYADGEKVGTTDATAFTLAGDDTHAYQVVAVYTVGESALSAVYGTPNAIGSATLQAVDLASARMAVFTLDGVKVAEGQGVYARLRPGVYVVRLADGRALRVVKR